MNGVLHPGLVSISFRGMDVPAIIALARRAELHGIEWGGDAHVPPGDVAVAREVAARTREGGLQVAGYGSYYRLGAPARGHLPAFEDVLTSAKALGAPQIRVWAGIKPSGEVTDAEFEALAEDARRICALASAQGLSVGLEYHEGTYTDSSPSALRLLNQVPGLHCYWQPPNGRPAAECQAGLQALISSGRLADVHVFHWWPKASDRWPLVDGALRWAPYLGVLSQAHGERHCSLEFVKHDSPEQLVQDAHTLKAWLAALRHPEAGA